MHEAPPRVISRRSVLTALVAAPLLAGATPVAPAPPTDATPSLATTHGRIAAPAITPLRAWAPAWVPPPTGLERAVTTRLVVHHTFEPVAASAEAVPATLTEIAGLHLDRGFDTFGYHYVVDPWGGTWQGRGSLPEADGRAPLIQDEGAHVAGSNPGALGIAFLGDHNAAPPTEAALGAAVHLLAWLVDSNDLDTHGKVGAVSSGAGTALHTGTFEVPVLAGHRDSNATECPGSQLAALLPLLRDRVGQVLAHGSTTNGIQPAPPAAIEDVADDDASRRSLVDDLRTFGLRSLSERLTGTPLG